MIEEPDPRGPRRSTRWALSIVAAALTAGAMAAGAWALTGSSDPPATPPANPAAVYRVHNEDAAWHSVGDHPCWRKHGNAATTKGSVSY